MGGLRARWCRSGIDWGGGRCQGKARILLAVVYRLVHVLGTVVFRVQCEVRMRGSACTADRL